MSLFKDMYCDWCESRENQEYLDEDVFGHLYVCRECGHEYVIPTLTKKGEDFYKSIDEILDDFEKTEKIIDDLENA